MLENRFELRLIADTLAAGRALTFPADHIHRIVYVVHGGVAVAGRTLGDDEAWYGQGAAEITAGPTGAALWRWELASPESPLTRVPSGSGATLTKLSSPLAGPVAGRILLRADSVSFPPGGCAWRHTHQGPGIRCLIEGGIRIDSEGRSASYGPGDAWFESGPEPVFAEAAADRPTRFIRVMILPVRLVGQSSITYVNAEDREKPKAQRYKGFVDEPIEP